MFLALWRLVYLTLTSILALSRLDKCLFTVLKGADRGYASFLAMALMLHSFQVPLCAVQSTPSSVQCVYTVQYGCNVAHSLRLHRTVKSSLGQRLLYSRELFFFFGEMEWPVR